MCAPRTICVCMFVNWYGEIETLSRHSNRRTKTHRASHCFHFGIESDFRERRRAVDQKLYLPATHKERQTPRAIFIEDHSKRDVVWSCFASVCFSLWLIHCIYWDNELESVFYLNHCMLWRFSKIKERQKSIWEFRLKLLGSNVFVRRSIYSA